MIKYINIVLFTGMLVMNYLANALPLNKKTTRELSDSFPNLFVPAGITFSIWGIIYLLLLGYIIIQFTGSNQIIISGISWLFALTCVLNALWIVFWHYGKLPLSLVVMIGLLITLIHINTLIHILPSGLIKACFGIYLGWICIATIANVTALLVNYRWESFGISQEIWTIVMISIGTFITIITIYRIDNPYVGLPVIWAFAGIIIKRNNDFRSIAFTAASALVIVAMVTIYGFFKTIL
jgi:TspO/MBR family